MKTPGEILEEMLTLYPEAGELWSECYSDITNLRGIITREELMWDLFDMGRLVGIVSDEEFKTLCREYGARQRGQ